MDFSNIRRYNNHFLKFSPFLKDKMIHNFQYQDYQLNYFCIYNILQLILSHNLHNLYKYLDLLDYILNYKINYFKNSKFTNHICILEYCMSNYMTVVGHNFHQLHQCLQSQEKYYLANYLKKCQYNLFQQEYIIDLIMY